MESVPAWYRKNKLGRIQSFRKKVRPETSENIKAQDQPLAFFLRSRPGLVSNLSGLDADLTFILKDLAVSNLGQNQG